MAKRQVLSSLSRMADALENDSENLFFGKIGDEYAALIRDDADDYFARDLQKAHLPALDLSKWSVSAGIPYIGWLDSDDDEPWTREDLEDAFTQWLDGILGAIRSYLDSIPSVNKAWFRAERERLGLSQSDIADDLDHNITTVKRWENPSYPDYSPSDEAVTYLESRRGEMDTAVANAMDIIESLVDAHGAPESIQLRYYRDQAMLDEFGREPAHYGYVNAINREVAAIVESQGINVDWVYPTDDDVIQTP